ncbi:unnamed protein product [Pleuronectes platessa]|uniref:Uncharacterized protein n=1 Tax=Pleuronectes platessa TaxID=8262 RepID=A0A9N7UAP4_PLEPL|nr:unnamed protein product [Pleuronectes platessa]
MEEELAKHLKQLADQFHGLAPVKCRELAFEYAEKINIPVPANWTEKHCAATKSSGDLERSGEVISAGKKQRSLHGFVPVTPEAEAPRCAKAASRCFSLRCDRHKVLTWEWMGASCYLRLGAALKRPV